jgi:hypothetical protein
MSSKRRLRRMCEHKKSFDTQEQAWKMARWSYRKFGDILRPYKCRLCGKWHNGHPRGYREMVTPRQVQRQKRM